MKTRRVPGREKSMRDMRRVPSKIYKVISTQKEPVIPKEYENPMLSTYWR